MSVTFTQSIQSSQADYDAGVRCWYCPSCRNVVTGVIPDAPTCVTFEGNEAEMLAAGWNSGTETFSFTKYQ